MANNELKQNFNSTLHNYFYKMKVLQNILMNTLNNYRSRDLYKEYENLLDKSIAIIDSAMTKDINFTMIRLIGMKTTLFFECAKILSNNKNEDTAIEILLICFHNIRNYLTNPFIIYLAMKIINYYAHLHIKHEQYEDALAVLELADRTYKKYYSKESKLYYISADLFSPISITPSDNDKRLEKIMTNNYEMLAHVYNKSQLYHKFFQCYHHVLDRYYKMPDNDLLIWSNKVTSLALYFLKSNRFKEARHHFTAAVHALYQFEKILKNGKDSQTNTHRWQELHETFANIAIGWVKYGLDVFNVSKEKIIKQIHNDTDELSETIIINDTSEKQQFHNIKQELFFESLDVSYYTASEVPIVITNTTEARILFHHTYVWLKKLKITFSVEKYPMKYMNAILDLSELYKFLAYYEENLKVKYTLSKLRGDVVENLSQIFQEIHPQCWPIAEPLMLHELGVIQLELMGLNMQQLCEIYENNSSNDKQSSVYNIIKNVSDLQNKLHELDIEH